MLQGLSALRNVLRDLGHRRVAIGCSDGAFVCICKRSSYFISGARARGEHCCYATRAKQAGLRAARLASVRSALASMTPVEDRERPVPPVDAQTMNKKIKLVNKAFLKV